MDNIQSVLIVGATHGNELSGVSYVSNHIDDSQRNQALATKFPNLKLNWMLANQAAMHKRTRYVDEDLNRQFTADKLADKNPISKEHQLAHSINTKFGPKGDSTTDLVIDIHNTTSNMGPTLILLESDAFHQSLGRFVKHNMPSAIILVEDEKPYLEHNYLCTIGKKGVMIEVGPQAHGILRAQAYLQTQQMCELILAFCELHNHNKLPSLAPVDAFRFIELVSYPVDSSGKINAMIHPNLQDKDFAPLNSGEPMFLGFDLSEIVYRDQQVVYPHFIGETAYYHLGVAFATASKSLF